MIDIAPTILEVAGAKATDLAEKLSKDSAVPARPGKSLVSVFTKDNSVKNDYLWWLHECNRAIRVGEWKLVAAKGDPWELYFMSADRAEVTNLAAKYPAKVSELESIWTRHWEETMRLHAGRQ